MGVNKVTYKMARNNRFSGLNHIMILNHFYHQKTVLGGAVIQQGRQAASNLKQVVCSTEETVKDPGVLGQILMKALHTSLRKT